MIPIITVDGPSGVGKGTLCAQLAQYYGYHFLDSGALYRLVGLAMIQRDWQPDTSDLVEFARALPVSFVDGEIWLNGEIVTQAIRNERVAAAASQVAAVPAIRSALVEFQRAYVKLPGLIADGRDMGTVIFPEARAKLFLDASAEVRAERRLKQLKNQGLDANIDQITLEIKERDHRDRNRPIAPLRAADDALIIDSSDLSVDAVFHQAIAWIEKQLTSKQ